MMVLQHKLSFGIILLSLVLSIRPINACELIGSWIDLVDAVRTATSTLLLCPFDIEKPESERLLLNKRLNMTCFGATETSKCTVRGTGHHFRIAGTVAEIVLDGFAFRNATQCAIRVLSTAPKHHEIRNCDFIDNAGQFNKWRGGAIKTEPSTNVTVSTSTFIRNSGGTGGAIFHRGNSLMIEQSNFEENTAKQGGAIQTDPLTFLSIRDSTFVSNTATIRDGGAIVIADSSSSINLRNTTGIGNSPCNGVYSKSSQSCDDFDASMITTTRPTTTTHTTTKPTSTEATTPTTSTHTPTTTLEPFVPGNLTIRQEGLHLSEGLTVKVLARAGELVEFTSDERSRDMSTIPFHAEPDGAAVFELEDGGWAYVSNSELPSRDGGVFSLEFDSEGRPRSYRQLLNNTSRNCAGGITPWKTWVSCEEYASGQCWQVHPTSEKSPQKTELVEPTGGNFESMAVDNRNPAKPIFFTTEDHERGALRRFTPCNIRPSWEMLHREGSLHYLEFLSDNKFRWTSSLSKGRESAYRYFKNVEGISHDDGILSFVSKKQKEIFHLNLDAGTYTKATTVHQNLPGGGGFGAGPDQLLLFSDVLYFTEDGGRTPGIYAHDGSRFYALVEGYSEDYHTDETTGFAFSPDGTKFYFAIQEIGYLFQLERKDGRPFNYSRRLLGLRFRQGY